jgi:GNAT superfamily N-acetyltransferase
MERIVEQLSGLTIREMQKEELAFAAECTAAEGWVSENQSTLEGFYLYDPSGCLLAVENGKPVGICIATCYGVNGFIGELIVRPEARGRGVGAALLNHGVDILKHRGVETVYLDGVVKAVQLYERNGFCKVCRSWRFSGTLPEGKSTGVRRMTSDDLDQVFALDKRSFGEDRSFFLRHRLKLYPQLGYVMENKGTVFGFILGRAGPGWLSAGPWVVEEWVTNPLELLYAFAHESNNMPISLGVLDTHQRACTLLQSLGFMAQPDSPWRMALGIAQNLGTSACCYAVGSAAKG